MTPDTAVAAVMVAIALTYMAVSTVTHVLAWARADVARMVTEALDDALDVEDDTVTPFLWPPAPGVYTTITPIFDCWAWADDAVRLAHDEGWPNPAWPGVGDFEADALAEIAQLTGEGT